MKTYTIPALAFENEFTNLDWIGTYVDGLMASQGETAYGVIYEWDDDSSSKWPPVAVLRRRDGKWFRRPVLLSGRLRGNKVRWNGLTLGDEESM
jgi:hypothetical protein